MKKTILISLVLLTFKTFAFGVNLSEKGIMKVDELVEMGAETVECSQAKPRCIIVGSQYGIQYPGQRYSEVSLEETFNALKALASINGLKKAGLCE